MGQVLEPDQLVALADAAEAGGVGGKARGLARQLAAGARVPGGVVVPHAALCAAVGEPSAAIALTPEALATWATRIAGAPAPHALAEAARARLGDGPLIVRSSTSLEDAAAGAAPGVFASQLDVDGAGLAEAIRTVWASACTPLVAAYARGRGTLEVGVLVQRQVAGARVVVYTRGAGDELLIQQAGVVTRVPRAAATSAVARAALAAEATLGAPAGADVELIVEAPDVVHLVQARPIVAPRRAVRSPPPPALLAPLRASGLAWRWDVEHNPAPLSTAQAELVARVAAAGHGAWHLATVAGYLYAAPRADAPHVAAPADAATLRAALDALEARLAAALAAPALDLPAAIARFLAFHAIWADQLAPLVAAARADLAATTPPATLAALLAVRPRSVAALLARLARAVAAGSDDAEARVLLADHAPAWDVAAPTFAERPELLAAPPPPSRPPPPPVVEAKLAARAAVVADALELDDHWFARAQAQLRHALRAVGEAAGLGDDVFWLSWDELLADAPRSPEARRALAAAARAASTRARSWRMPLTLAAAEAPLADTGAWRGAGGGGDALGPVHRLVDVAAAGRVPPGAIVVAEALTPALAVVLAGAGALVADTGGALDHGAAMARELGVPYVVGAAGAWDGLADGELVEVRGEAGEVRRVAG